MLIAIYYMLCYIVSVLVSAGVHIFWGYILIADGRDIKVNHILSMMFGTFIPIWNVISTIMLTVFFIGAHLTGTNRRDIHRVIIKGKIDEE